MTNPRRRVLIVAFDALRPDMVTPELMPNLCAFASAGVRFRESRATFPTETRVNQSALVTGCYPARHGIVANKFLEPAASPDRLFNTGDEDQLASGDEKLGGRLVDVPVLGEILAAHGMNLAVVGAGTPGGTRMLHHKAEAVGGFRLSLQRPDASVPDAAAGAVQTRFGPIPPQAIPSIDWLGYATDVYLEYVEPTLEPDVAILWFCEPDNSYHHCGIGSADNLAAIREADVQFGRILRWREGSGPGDRLQLITLSDHGQLTVVEEPVAVADGLMGAGFTVAETLSQGADAAIALDSAGGIYVRDSNPRLIAEILQWLQSQPWCGPVFTRAGRGALRHDQVGIDHRRAPDIGVVLASDDTVNPYGQRGACRHDTSSYPIGGGLHGGLHAIELHNWLAVAGDAFRQGEESRAPAGIVDVMPTVLQVLGVSTASEKIDGRVLCEALAGKGRFTEPEYARESFIAQGAGGYSAMLNVSRVGATTYLERAWAER